MRSFTQNKDLKKEELEAAFLAAFFKGKTTQDSITDFLELSNIHALEHLKLPTTFDGIVKVITGEKPKFMFSKSWFCGICLKLIAKLKNRFQRNCEICKTKYLYF